MNRVEKLPVEFSGSGEFNGFTFRQVYEGTKGYMYLVNNKHFEIFRKKVVPKCIDFNNRIYSETDLKEVYAEPNDFGVTAFTESNIKDAFTRLYQITYSSGEEIK